MSRTDHNHLSFTGDAEENIYLNGELLFHGHQPGMRHYEMGDILPPPGTSDSIKITSGCCRLHITANRVIGGSEDCVDINNECRDIVVDAIWEPRGKYLATIKGGSRDIELRGRVVTQGKEVTIDLGNHSDQSKKRTEGVFLNLTCNQPITWRRINATTPQIRAGQKFKKKLSVPGELRAFFAAAYIWLKRIGVPICLVLTGCGTNQPVPPRIDAAPTLTAQADKDTKILASADNIDTAVKGTPPEAPVKAETAAIRVAIQTAPAADVTKLVISFESAIKTLESQNTKLLEQLNAERQRAMREQSRTLNWAGFGFLAMFGISLVFGHLAAAMKTWPLIILGAGCFGLAQLISHKWFLPSFAALAALGIGYTVYWVIDRHRQGRLQQALEKRVNVLKQTIPVLDQAYDEATDEVKKLMDRSIFDRLSDVMTAEEKAEIHHLRADNKVAS